MPLENAVNELAALELNDSEVKNSPKSTWDWSCTELTPSELEKKIYKKLRKRAISGISGTTAPISCKLTRASRRIELDGVGEEQVKSKTRHVR